jgi:hypothetical protein
MNFSLVSLTELINLPHDVAKLVVSFLGDIGLTCEVCGSISDKDHPLWPSCPLCGYVYSNIALLLLGIQQEIEDDEPFFVHIPQKESEKEECKDCGEDDTRILTSTCEDQIVCYNCYESYRCCCCQGNAVWREVLRWRKENS